jgi:hypothetical protein
MKRKSLLIMLLVALFVPLAMNAQTRSLHSPKLDKLKMNSAVARENAQNEMFVKSPVQIPNLDSRNFSLGNANNAMGNRVTRDGVEYEMVTSSQSDWSGNYVLAVPFDETYGYAFDGDIDEYNTGGIAEVTLEDYTTMTSIGDAAVLTIAPSTSNSSYYTIKINGGDYLADGTSGLETSSTETNYTNWDISLTSDGMQLYNPVWSGGPYYLYFLLFTDTSTNQSGAFWLTDDGTSYTSETVEGYEFEYIFPFLYKEVSSGGGSADCDYEKVTASQSDWSGDYVITYVSGTTAYVLTGKNANGNYGAYTTATVTNDLLANADVAAYNVTIEPVTYNNQTKYTLKIGNTYLGYTSTTSNSNGTNYLYFTESIPSSNPQRYYWTIAYSNNTVTLTSVYNTRRKLQYNTSQPRFACYATTQGAITLFKKLTDCEPTCPTPTNLTYSNVTGEGATLAWNGEADSYTIQIGPAPKTYGFEDGTLQGWTAYDADGDGASWDASNLTSSSGATFYHSGTYFAMSSYNESAAADNWLISPQIQLGGSISFWVRRFSTSYTDNYRVYVSTTNTDISSFTEISSGTITPGTSYTQASYPLSSYSGTGYIAIRHTANADQAYVFVDDITIVEGGQTIPNVTSPYTITGLNPATEYVWQVKADCGDGDVSPWSTSSTFTTLDLCATPTDLSSADITNNSAALSWTGLADAYDIQYREYDATAPVTVILTAGDVWGDGSGYQMLLDADATAYDNFSTNGISDYSIFEYKIPTNADYSASTSNIVVNSSVSIQIPAGTYDCFIANPTPGDQVYVAGTSGNVGGRIDNYVFEAGLTYEFVPSRYGTGDGVDVTITGWTPVSGTVTSPYTLTGLNPGTTYAWQVQGEGCDNWSASNVFTTLNGTLVESITASDVTVLVGETATITPTVLPADATNPAVTYSSADETIATVNENGVVTGVAPGETTITISATDGSGVTGTITVTVNGIDVTGITPGDDITIMTGETATITYTVAPNNATDPSVTFTSADETIATVDADGVVTGVAAGNTTITIASVQNPEVTATITVTVTSNPNAVQFTVNAPATARPGDVITVEAVLNAPESGDYTGFTGLVIGLHFDNEVFAVNGNPVKGPVADASIMASYSLPNENHETVNYSCVMTPGNPNTTTGVVFSIQFTVLEEVELGNYTFYVEPTAANNFVYNPGSAPTPIMYEYVPSTVKICNTYYLQIAGWSNAEEGASNFYLIASPIGDVNPTDVTIQGETNANMVTGDFDLFYFDHNRDLEWVNYKPVSAPGFNLLESGKGYLYANIDNVTLEFTGIGINSGEKTIALDYYEIGDDFTIDLPGWNLLGNPFATTAYLTTINSGITTNFYTMDKYGRYLAVTNGSIEAMEGVFVHAEGEGQSVTFTTTQPGKSPALTLNLSNDSRVIDRAIARFDRGGQLPKIQFREGSTKLFIPVDGQDFAVVSAEEVGEMPVSFMAESNGTYNLNINTENVEFGYLHLIDNMTGADVDLLVNPSYSFEARTTDYANRFKLVYATGNANDIFAFFSNGSLVINNDGAATLQVIDVTGRILKSESINGCTNINLNEAAGVYVIRLVNSSNVKTQKIVVR